jgi:IS4 transposase
VDTSTSIASVRFIDFRSSSVIRAKRNLRFRRLVFLTSLFSVSTKTVADICKKRRQVELFCKWIKGHLRINSFYGTSANVVKTQVCVANIVYLHVAIAK